MGIFRRLGAFCAFVAMSTVAGVCVTATVVPGAWALGTSGADGVEAFESLPSYLAIGPLAQPTTIFATGSDGAVHALATFYAQNRLPVDLDQMAPAVSDAAIAAEDPRFFRHGGMDLQGTIRGALATALGGNVQGGSTITQQYVKNVLLQKCEALPSKTDEERSAVSACVSEATGVSAGRKVREIRLAIGLEKRYTKKQILEGYLNIAGFGGTVYGIEAAAQYYFGTSAAALTPAQAASLIAIVNEPSALRIDEPNSPTNGAANGYAQNKQRRDYILAKMLEYHRLTRAQYDAAIATPVEPRITPSIRGCQVAGGAAYFCDYVQRIFLNDPAFGADEDTRIARFNRGGYAIYTSLDLDLQRAAEAVLADWAPKTYARADLGAVMVGVQPGTGRVLYMAQNKDYTQSPSDTGANFSAVNYATDQRYGGSRGFQVGSTYKVFTLAQWLSEGHSLSETVNADYRTYRQSSFTDTCGGPWTGTYRPTNDSSGETGRRSALQATALSINTAFIAMAHELDLCAIAHRAQGFDVHTATGEPLNTNPASVLGTNTIAPLTMATAFAGIANGGVTCTPIAIDRILDSAGGAVPAPKSDCRRSVSARVAEQMAVALQAVTRWGTASGLNATDWPMLAKTGTTDSNEQIWLVAATTHIAGAYWIGNISGHANMRVIRPAHGMTPAGARVRVMRTMMSAAVAKYGGGPFNLVEKRYRLAVRDVLTESAENGEFGVRAQGARDRCQSLKVDRHHIVTVDAPDLELVLVGRPRSSTTPPEKLQLPPPRAQCQLMDGAHDGLRPHLIDC